MVIIELQTLLKTEPGSRFLLLDRMDILFVTAACIIPLVHLKLVY